MKILLLSGPATPSSTSISTRIPRLLSILTSSGMMVMHHTVETKSDLMMALIAFEQPDIVFDTAYRVKNRSGSYETIHGILEEMGFPYIGSGAEVLDLVLSKSSLKNRWKQTGIHTPDYYIVNKTGAGVQGLEQSSQITAFPYILKPDCEGNSRGLSEASIVFDQVALEKQLGRLLEHYDQVLVEKYLGTAPDFREYTVAMIGNGVSQLLMPAEITLLRETKLRVVTTRDKENHLTRARPVQDPEISKRLTDLAGRAFQAAGVQDYARCDLIYAHGNLFAVEINGQPMVPDKWFEVCARSAGLDMVETIQAILVTGIKRNIELGYGYLKLPPELTPLWDKLLN